MSEISQSKFSKSPLTFCGKVKVAAGMDEGHTLAGPEWEDALAGIELLDVDAGPSEDGADWDAPLEGIELADDAGAAVGVNPHTAADKNVPE